MKIAMWSGPRNLSTAMMYSFANREDTSAVDEPFYAAYLAATGLDHPVRDAVLASQPTDPQIVEKSLLESDTEHFYQKHMTQHMLDGFPLDWMAQVRNVFLIRHPARVIASWSHKHDVLTLGDIGFVQQTALFERVLEIGHRPIVVDSGDIRRNPEAMLRALCAEIGIDWDPAMLSWPVGPKPFDGAWAPHWYGAVHQSTGFAGAEGSLPELEGAEASLCEQAMPHYEALRDRRIRV